MAVVELLNDTLARHGLTMEQVRAFLKENPRFNNALHRAPFSAGSTPAELINEIADYINKSGAERWMHATRQGLSGARDWAKAAFLGAPTNAQKSMELGREFAIELAEIAKDHGPTLVKKGIEQARAQVQKLPLPAPVTSLFAPRATPLEKAS